MATDRVTIVRISTLAPVQEVRVGVDTVARQEETEADLRVDMVATTAATTEELTDRGTKVSSIMTISFSCLCHKYL